jgi:hypothetical protein
MAKRTSLEESLARLHALRSAADSAEARAELAKALDGKNNLLAARAASIIGEKGLGNFADKLIAAFDRFMIDAGATDKGCSAKTAIASALYEQGVSEAGDLFLKGIRHVQMEASYGGGADTAVELRCACALGLVRIGHRQALLECTDLLADRQPQARVGAARALAYSGRDEAALLLRLKALSGDREVDVTAECLAGLMRIAPRQSLRLIEAVIDASIRPGVRADPAALAQADSLRDAAALAVAGWRHPDALALLTARYTQWLDDSFRKSLLLAIATLRLPQAVDFLMGIVENGPVPAADDALEALRIYRHDDAIRQRVTGVVQGRGDPKLVKAFATTFGT